jgi:plastocyanin
MRLRPSPKSLAWSATLLLAVGACKESKPAAPKPATESKPAAATAEPAKPTEAPKPAEPAPAPASDGIGKLSGTVTLARTAPAETAIDMKADPKCGKLSPGAKTNDHVVKDGKLANVFVYVKEGLPDQKWKAPDATIVLDQKGCRYEPKMVAVMVGQELEIVNSDPTLHNIHAFGKQEFNIGMPTQGQRIKRKFRKEEVLVQVKCDVHPWMEAHIGVTGHPFAAVTDAEGKFTIADVPAGKYTVGAIHPKLGELTGTIEVKKDAESELSLEYAAK